MSRMSFALAVAIMTASTVCTSPVIAQTHSKSCPELAALDPDNDGTIDLKEAQAAASSLFDQLDPDKDGTLDRNELKGRLSANELKKADPDRDGTLDKTEFLKVVERRFNAANPDKDGTIDCRELKTTAGQSLMRLLVK